MTAHPRTPARAARSEADEGSAIVLVLVLAVVGSLMVLPLLNYVVSVGRANSVLADKIARQEAVKAGLRAALADPSRLYEYCGEFQTLASPWPDSDGIPIRSRCHFVDASQAADDEDLHLGVATTMVGKDVPQGLAAIVEKEANGEPKEDENGNPLRYVFPQTGTVGAATDWQALTATSSEPTHIWAPNLPVHALNQRSPLGYQMPDGFPQCTVYFPGTYVDPLTVSGPTYFTSGIYYFQNTVTFGAGSDAVVGMGYHQGCTTDQEAVFYAVGAPTAHNISGLGATFVLGDLGRLRVTNETGATHVRFNQRYVNPTDTGALPSFGVSIMSVNGVVVSGPDATGKYVIDRLVVSDGTTNLVDVPASLVGTPDDPDDPDDSPPVLAGEFRYRPSRLTHQPRPPSQPLAVTGAARKAPTSGAALVSWQPPDQLGGRPITSYEVTSTPGNLTCLTTGLDCLVTGLTVGTTYTFTVRATNEIGTSPASAATGNVQPLNGSPPVGAPAVPATPQVQRDPDGTVQVSWAAPADGGDPITGYTVAATPTLDPSTHPCVKVTETSCTIAALPMLDPDDLEDPEDPVADYTFTVSATNRVGSSAASAPSDTAVQIPDSVDPAPTPPEPEPPVTVEAHRPDAIVDIDLTSATNAVAVDIPGYIAVPQGVVRLNNPHGLAGDADLDGRSDDGNVVTVSGGMLAAELAVHDTRATPEGLTVPVGLVNLTVQRTFQIITETTSGTPHVMSRAVVQINQNGAYAVNTWEVQ